MDIHEAIEHCRERADGTPCGMDHAQLAAWLMELVGLRAERSHADAAEARVAELEARERRLWAVLEGVSRGYEFGSRAFDFLHDRDLDALCAALGVEVDDE